MDLGYISSRTPFDSPRREREQSASDDFLDSPDISRYANHRARSRKFLRHQLESEIRSGTPFDYRSSKSALSRELFKTSFPAKGLERVFLDDRVKRAA